MTARDTVDRIELSAFVKLRFCHSIARSVFEREAKR